MRTFTPEGNRLFGVADLTEDELTEIFATYNLPDPRLRARWAKKEFWAWRDTDPVLAVVRWRGKGLVRNEQEALDILGAMRAKVIAKDNL